MPVLPALLMVGLVLALVWRSRTPVWLPLAGFLLLFVLNVFVWFIFGAHIARDALSVLVYVALQAWCTVGCLILLVASVSVLRQWRQRAALVLSGFGVVAPLMALLVAAGVG